MRVLRNMHFKAMAEHLTVAFCGVDSCSSECLVECDYAFVCEQFNLPCIDMCEQDTECASMCEYE